MLMDYVKYSVLSQCDWFVNADHQNIVSLTQLVHLEHFEKNTEIVRQGDRNSDIGILADGELEIIYQSPQNQIIPISKIKPLGWFGEVHYLKIARWFLLKQLKTPLLYSYQKML